MEYLRKYVVIKMDSTEKAWLKVFFIMDQYTYHFFDQIVVLSEYKSKFTASVPVDFPFFHSLRFDTILSFWLFLFAICQTKIDEFVNKYWSQHSILKSRNQEC